MPTPFQIDYVNKLGQIYPVSPAGSAGTTGAQGTTGAVGTTGADLLASVYVSEYKALEIEYS